MNSLLKRVCSIILVFSVVATTVVYNSGLFADEVATDNALEGTDATNDESIEDGVEGNTGVESGTDDKDNVDDENSLDVEGGIEFDSVDTSGMGGLYVRITEGGKLCLKLDDASYTVENKSGVVTRRDSNNHVTELASDENGYCLALEGVGGVEVEEGKY